MTLKRAKKELEEQNDFLQSFLRSLDDIKHGRTREFKFHRSK